MRKKKAELQKKLKGHIRRRGDSSDFDITETFCTYWWHRLNEVVFDGILTAPVRFEIKAFRETAGWCKPYAWNRKQRRVTMGINKEIGERKKFLEVLAHEMVHQWEWEILAGWNCKVQHGQDFWRWENKLKHRAGLPLATTIDI